MAYNGMEVRRVQDRFSSKLWVNRNEKERAMEGV